MLFDKFKLKNIELSNRIVMAPMTRTRSKNGMMTEMNAEYYRQRASVGLIVTEGTAISPTSMGYLNVPGLYHAAQTESWKKVTTAVHEQGGRIFTQLWHVGRVSHYSNQPNHFQPVAPSAIQARDTFPWGIENGRVGRVQASEPRELATAEIAEIVADYVKAARNAMEAGFDGIEIPAANGYLLDQFLNPDTNHREDGYGGAIVNRTRLVLEVVDAIAGAIGAERTGIRFSPYGRQHDMSVYPELEDTFRYLSTELAKRQIAFIHLNDQGAISAEHPDFLSKMRKWYDGTIVYAGSLTKEKAEKLLAQGVIDLAAFGRPLIANPDLVERLKNEYPLAPGIRELYYGSTPEGYIDYPDYRAPREPY